MVSSDFGKLEVQRHFNSGVDCAMAGMATAEAAVAAPVSPAALRNSRRFIVSSEKALCWRGDVILYRNIAISRSAQTRNPSVCPKGALFSPARNAWYFVFSAVLVALPVCREGLRGYITHAVGPGS